jgi:hypothetical protein
MRSKLRPLCLGRAPAHGDCVAKSFIERAFYDIGRYSASVVLS